MAIPFDALIYGLLLGGILTAAAVGFTLVYGVLDIVNVAHGVFIILGGYVSFWMMELYGIGFLLAVPISFVVLFIIGYVLQIILFQRLIGEKILYMLLATFGAALIGRNLMNYFWSPNYRSIQTKYGGMREEFLGVTVPMDSVLAFLIALGLTAAVYLFLFRTTTGRAIRAVRDSDDLAEVYGVNTKRIYALTMGIGAGTAAIAGSLIAMQGPINPVMEFNWTVNAFIVVVLGGVGSVFGALVGGLALGLVINLTNALVSNELSYAFAYTLLFVILVVKPTGIFGLEHELKH